MKRALLTVGAAAVLVSAYMHYYLYFHGGYRGISPERFAGLDISRSFLLNAIAGTLIATALVVSLRLTSWQVPAAAIGVLYALGALGAYVLARTSGFLGFDETTTTVEAVISKTAELVAVAVLGWFLVQRLVRKTPAPAPI